ncbi:MAG: iron-containing alcohol dehydrogenase family protein [Actinomycetaceae bacterium]
MTHAPANPGRAYVPAAIGTEAATFRATTRIVAGPGALARTRAEVERLGSPRLVVVADRSLDRVGLLQHILSEARLGDLVVETVLTDVDPDPDPIEAAASTARAANAQAVLAIGGGSGISAAKAVALLLTNHVPVRSLEGVDKATAPPAPTIAIPTTAGSGSEVSNALVLHDPGRVREITIRGDGYEPHTAVLDAAVLRGLPTEPLLFAALDAISHALEATWARGANIFTDACALRAASELIETLPRAVSGVADGRNAAGGNDPALQRLLEASALANLACGNSGLALVHALSCSPAVPSPHGYQNGVLLPHVAAFNRDVVGPDARDLIDRLPGLYDAMRFPTRFPEGIADADAMIAASSGHAFRANNRRESTDDELRDLLLAAGADYRPATR